MHEHIREWIKTLFICAALSVVGYQVWTNGQRIKQTTDQLQPVIANVNVAAQNLADASGDESDAVRQQIADLRQLTGQATALLGQTTTTVQALNGPINGLGRSLDDVGSLAEALKGTVEAARPVVLALQPLPAKVGAAVDAYAQAGVDLDAQLKNDAVRKTLTHIESITDSGAGIMADSKRITDKVTADYMKPVPWYLVPVHRLGETWDIAAFAAKVAR
jgi:hypothetical protein